MHALTKDDLLRRLIAFDEEVYLNYVGTIQGERFYIVIVDGGALLLSGMIARSTHDMDAIDISPKLQEFMGRYDINTHVSAHGDTFAFNYPDRLQRLDIPGRIIDFYSASLEDIIISKLCAYRPHDIEDITTPKVLAAVNWELLHHLATDQNELRVNILSKYRYDEFLFRFTEYERKYRPCGS